MPKRIAPNSAHLTREGHAAQPFTPFKRVCPNALHRAGERDAGEHPAPFERVSPNHAHRAGEGYIREGATPGKRPFPDVGRPAGEGDAGEAGAVGKRTLPNGCDAAGNRNLGKAVVPFKGGAADTRHAVLNLHSPDLPQVGRLRFAAGTVRHRPAAGNGQRIRGVVIVPVQLPPLAAVPARRPRPGGQQPHRKAQGQYRR